MIKSRNLQDHSLKGVSALSFFIVLAAFAWLSADIFRQGLSSFQLSFITSAPENAGRAGGIRPVISSTFLILIVTLSAAIPTSFAAAVVLSGKVWPAPKFSRLIQMSISVLAGVPSIVFGLFGNVLFCQYLGMGYSILSGGLTLACMILPLSIKLLEESISSVPDRLILSAEALGLSRYTLIMKIIIPQTFPQLTASYILSTGRALAETAALLFTSGYVMRDPLSILDSGRTLSIHIYDLSMNISGGNQNAYRTAVLLLGLLIAINFTGHLINYLWRSIRYGQ